MFLTKTETKALESKPFKHLYSFYQKAVVYVLCCVL